MFSKLLSSNSSDFLKILECDDITVKEAIESFIKAEDFDNKFLVFYEIVKKIKEKKIVDLNQELLKKFFNGEEEIIFDIYKNDFVEVFFPIVNKLGDGKIARAIIFESKKSFTNNPDLKSSLEKIESLVGKKLIVIFDSEFKGNSFELAVAIGSLCEKIPKNIAFTGEIDEKGNIKRNIEYLDLKMKICSENNLKLISAFDVDNLFELKEFFEAKKIHIPILISLMAKDKEYIRTSYEELKEAVNEKFEIKYSDIFEKIYDVNKVFVKDSLNDDWGQVLKEVNSLLYKIISNRGIPHIAIMGPASFSMALGIALGVQNPLVVYHKAGIEYKPVIDLTDNVRKVKNIVSDYKFVKYSVENENGKNCAFILYFASHNPYDAVKNFLSKNNIDSKLVLIEPNFGKGNLPAEDWSEIVSEIMSVTQNIQFKHSCENVFFFMSCPVPLAFGVGLSFGDFAKGSIFHFDKNTGDYIEVFKIEKIRG